MCKLVTANKESAAQLHEDCCNASKETDLRFESIGEAEYYYNTTANAVAEQFKTKRYLTELPKTQLQATKDNDNVKQTMVPSSDMFAEVTSNDFTEHIYTDPKLYEMVTTNRFNVGEIALIHGPEQMQMVTIMSASHPIYVIKEAEECKTIDTRIHSLYVPITKATQITLTHHSFYKDSMTSSFKVGDTAVYNGGDETFIRGKIVNSDHPNYCFETTQGERIFKT